MSKEKGLTILIVDDEPTCVTFLLHILRDTKHTILVAKNGQSAIDTAVLELPDLILSDIDMPNMNGYELITALKQIEETKNIPLIFVTSRANPEEIKKGLSMGAVDYLIKTSGIENIQTRVQAQINKLLQ